MTRWSYEDVRGLYKRAEEAEKRAEIAEVAADCLRAEIRTLKDRIRYSPKDDDRDCRCGTCYPCVLRRIEALEKVMVGWEMIEATLKDVERRLIEFENHPPGCDCTECTG